MQQQLHVKTFGETFPDWNMIELVAGDSPQADFNLVLWDKQQARIGSSFRIQASRPRGRRLESNPSPEQRFVFDVATVAE